MQGVATELKDWHEPEVLLADLPEVVRRSIGAPMPFPERHFAVFIIFSWNFPLFWSSLQTYMAAGWGKRVIILDNSINHRILKDPGKPIPFNGILLQRQPVLCALRSTSARSEAGC